MITTSKQAMRLATTIAVVAFALAGSTSALAATDVQEDQAVRATTDRLVEHVRTKLRVFDDRLSLSPASGTDVAPGTKVLARVQHIDQPGSELSGRIFLAAGAGAMPVRFPPTTFTPRDPATGVALTSSQAVTSPVVSAGRILPDRRLVLLRPRFFQAGSASPPLLARDIGARVPLQVDLPPLGQLASSMSSELGRSAPDNAEELVAFVFDHLTPAGFGTGDGLCKFLPRAHPQFCGATVADLTDPDPTHQGLFTKMSALDVTPAATRITRALSRSVDVLPLGIPSVSAWFRHKNFAVSDSRAHFTSAGFVLLAVPSGTPGASTPTELMTRLSELRQTLAKLSTLAGLATLPGSVDRLVARVGAYGGSAVRILNRAEDSLHDITMIDRTFPRNDIEAGDEISSAMAFGLPGGRWRAFVHSGFAGGAFTSGPGSSTWLDERADLHLLGFGDNLSSLRVEVNASPQ